MKSNDIISFGYDEDFSDFEARMSTSCAPALAIHAAYSCFMCFMHYAGVWKTRLAKLWTVRGRSAEVSATASADHTSTPTGRSQFHEP